LSNDGGSLSSDTGEFIFREFDEKIGFSQTLVNHLKLNDSRAYFLHSNEDLLRQKLYQIIAGYSEDDAADQLTNDPVFTQIIGTPALASQPSLSRFYLRFNEKSLEQLNQANQELLDKIHASRKPEALFIDLDSTHSDTYGNQESPDYNAHYGTMGFHPLVAFDGATGDFLKAKLRPGNVYTSNGVVEFVQPLIEHYNKVFPETSLFLRGDSGFAVPALYDLCEKESVFYIIRLKSNAQLQGLAKEYHPSIAPADVSKQECYYEETIYQAKSWSKPRRVIIQSVRPAGELFFNHAFFVTNFEVIPPKNMVRAYQKKRYDGKLHQGI
jgi:hypothetical protein